MHVDGSVRFKGRLCMLKDVELRNELLVDAHRAKYTIHFRSTKMYQDLKETILVEWDEKSHCLVCSQLSDLSASES